MNKKVLLLVAAGVAAYFIFGNSNNAISEGQQVPEPVLTDAQKRLLAITDWAGMTPVAYRALVEGMAPADVNTALNYLEHYDYRTKAGMFAGMPYIEFIQMKSKYGLPV